MSRLLPLSPDLLSKTVDGLILSGPLVPPTLEGRKTVTRRMSRKWLKRKAGDLLFVRENWKLISWDAATSGDPTVRIDYPRVASWTEHLTCPDREWLGRELGRTKAFRAQHGAGAPLRPSILLPRWASRCILRLTEDPRLEHVQEITEEDAKREGMTLPDASLPQCPCEDPDVENPGPHLPHCLWRQEHVNPDEYPYVAAFVCTWESLHVKPGERWSDDPLVVRLAFERCA